MSLSRVMHPNGRCCRATAPDIAKERVINSIYFREYVKDFPRMNVTGFQMFLSDKMSATFFHPLKFNIDGEHLKSSREQGGYIQFRIKIHEEDHLEDDPHFPCRDYGYPGEFDQCLEEEYVRDQNDNNRVGG